MKMSLPSIVLPLLAASLAAAAGEPKARLLWRNQEVLPGELLAADATTVTWGTPMVGVPAVLDQSRLQLVDFTRIDPPPPPGVNANERQKIPIALRRLREPPPPAPELFAPVKAEWSLLLRNGDCVHGDQAAVQGDAITLTGGRLGTVTVPVAEARCLRRLKGDGLVYAGPAGQGGWLGPCFTFDGGAVATRDWEREMELPVEVPEKAVVDVVLRSTQLMRFKLSFRHKSRRFPSLQTWGNQVVLLAPTEGMHFKPLTELKKGESMLALKLFMDLESRSARVFDAKGAELGSLQWSEPPKTLRAEPAAAPGRRGFSRFDRSQLGPVAPLPREINTLMVENPLVPVHMYPQPKKPASPPTPALIVKSGGANLVLDELRVRPWDGKALPPPPPAEFPRVELADGTWLSGDAAKGCDLSKAVAVVWADGLPPLRPKVPRPAAVFADGTVVSGSVRSCSSNALVMKTPWSAVAVRCTTESLRRLVFDLQGPPVPEPGLGVLDKLRQGPVNIHGTISGNGGTEPLWTFVGGHAALPIAIPAKREDVDLVWATPASPATTSPEAASYVITDGGEILNGSLKAIDETGVTFTSPWSPMQTLQHEHVRAVRLGSATVMSKGFRDPAWKSIGGPGQVKITPGDKPDKDKLELTAGGRYLHPGMVRGTEIRFTMKLPQSYGGLEVDLFTSGDDVSSAFKVNLWFTGNQLYVLSGDTNRGVSNNQMLHCENGSSINVKITFRDSKVQVMANETTLLNEAVKPAQRKHTGIELHSGSLWGNSVQPVEVTGFVVNENLGEIAPVSVEEKARAEALLVPRFRRDSFPTHALVAANGDLLRGRIEAATDRLVRFTSGLDSMNVPMDRVQNIIWLSKPKEEPKSGGKDGKDSKPDSAVPSALATAPPSPPVPAAALATTSADHWLVLQDKTRLALHAESIGKDKVQGTSALLGKFDVPLPSIAMMRWAAPAPTPAMRSYTDWQLENAPEPVLPESGSQSSPLLGKPAPMFKVPMLAGGEFDLAKVKGDVVVMDFWATWCGPCVSSMPEFIKVMKSFEGKKVHFLALDQGEPALQVQRFLKQRGWELPVAMDNQQQVGGKYGVDGIPHTVIIGTDGKVEWTRTGASADGAEKLTQAVKKALHEPP